MLHYFDERVFNIIACSMFLVILALDCLSVFTDLVIGLMTSNNGSSGWSYICTVITFNSDYLFDIQIYQNLLRSFCVKERLVVSHYYY